jgi:hypothetical protein
VNLEPIAKLLQSRGAGKIGEQIFVNEMPADCEHGVLIIPPYPGTPVNHYVRGWKRAEFRLAVRSTDYARGATYADKVHGMLTVYGELLVPGLLIKQLLPSTYPRPYRKSSGGVVEFEIEMEIVAVDA